MGSNGHGWERMEDQLYILSVYKGYSCLPDHLPHFLERGANPHSLGSMHCNHMKLCASTLSSSTPQEYGHENRAFRQREDSLMNYPTFLLQNEL